MPFFYPCLVKQRRDRPPRLLAALGQRPEADAARRTGHRAERLGAGDVVPRHVGENPVLRDSLRVERHLHASRRVVHLCQFGLQSPLGKVAENGFAVRILAYGADGPGIVAELRHVPGKVGRGAADLASFG